MRGLVRGLVVVDDFTIGLYSVSDVGLDSFTR